MNTTSNKPKLTHPSKSSLLSSPRKKILKMCQDQSIHPAKALLPLHLFTREDLFSGPLFPQVHSTSLFIFFWKLSSESPRKRPKGARSFARPPVAEPLVRGMDGNWVMTRRWVLLIGCRPTLAWVAGFGDWPHIKGGYRGRGQGALS